MAKQEIREFGDFTGENNQGYIIVGGKTADIEGGKKLLSDVIPSVPEQVQSDWEQDDDTQKDYIKNKPTITSSGYTRVDLGNITATNALFTINVNNKECIKAKLGPSSSMHGIRTFRLNLSNDCDDAIIDISDPYRLLRTIKENSVYRGNDKLLIMAPIVHYLTASYDILKSIRASGSGVGLPENFDDFAFAYPIATLGSSYSTDVKDLYNELDCEHFTRLIIRIVADYVYVHPIYEE